MTPALKLNLFVGFPSYGGNGGIAAEHPDIREWWVETALKLEKEKQRGRIGEVFTRTLNDTPITLVRNQFVKLAKHHNCHLLMMVDSDQSPNKHRGEPWFKPFWDEAFEFIYERYMKGPHLVFAPYCGAPEGKENCFCFKWHNYGNHAEQTEFSLEQYLREEALRMSGIQECAAGPTGLILYDLRCFDLIEPSGLSKREILEQVQCGKMTPRDAEMALNEGYFYYEWKDCHADEKASTEDVTNTRDISLAGCVKLGYNPVHCAWDSWIGHHKPWNVGRPQEFGPHQVGASLKKAVLADKHPNERIIDIGTLNQGDDPLSRRLREMAKSSEEAFKRNGHSNGNGKQLAGLMPSVDLQPEPNLVSTQWRPWDKSLALAERLAQGFVVEIGPGDRPFSKATEFVGRKSDKVTYGKPFRELDLNCDRLPYDDNSVDFIYCRHTLEDIDNPLWLLKEIQRVAKAGWIECPSPLAETARGVDAPGAMYQGKGYAHHRSIVWSSGSKLHIAPKLPALESIDIVERHDLLAEGAWYWNSYHLWSGKLDFQCHTNENDFNVHTDHRYEFLLRDACRAAINASRALYQFATSREPPELGFFPWYDGMGTPQIHLDFLKWAVEAQASLRPGEKIRVLEVGSLFGKTAIAMADAGATVHCVDHWQGSPTDPSGTHVNAAGGADSVYAEFLKQIGDRKDKAIHPWRKSSADAAAMYWQPFDIIFIDAEHTYEAAKQDIEMWWQHLRDDGVMLIHDFMTIQFPGVTKAVKELFGEVELQATCGHGSIAMVKKADYPELLCVAAQDH